MQSNDELRYVDLSDTNELAAAAVAYNEQSSTRECRTSKVTYRYPSQRLTLAIPWSAILSLVPGPAAEESSPR